MDGKYSRISFVASTARRTFCSGSLARSWNPRKMPRMSPTRPGTYTRTTFPYCLPKRWVLLFDWDSILCVAQHSLTNSSCSPFQKTKKKPNIQVSLDSRVRDIINNNIKKPTSNIFDEAQLQIYTLMHRDSYPRFINSPMYKKLAQIQTSSRKGSS